MFESIIRFKNKHLALHPSKNALLAVLRSQKCGLDHCLRNVKPVFNSKLRKMQGKTIF